MKNAVEKDERSQKIINEIKDLEKQLSIQETKLVEVEKDLSNDQAVLNDYQQQISKAVQSAETDDLKNLNKRIQSVERDVDVKTRMLNQIKRGIHFLTQEIKEQKEKLWKLLIWIMKREKIKREYEQVPDLFKPFLKENAEWIDSVNSVFDELKLKRPNSRDLALNVRGSYPFVEHMSFIGCPIPTALEVVNAKTHQEHFERTVKKFDRIINEFGEKKVPKAAEPEKDEKKGVIEKITNGFKANVDKVAAKVTPEEADQLFG